MNNSVKLFPYLIQFKLIVLLNFLDVILTITAIEIFGAQEMNPVMSLLLNGTGSFFVFAIVKICVLYLVLLYCLFMWSRKGVTFLSRPVWTGINCVYGLVVLWNLAMILFGLYELFIAT